MNEAPILERKIDRVLRLEPGGSIRAPKSEYWRLNSLRQRAEAKEPGRKFTLRTIGDFCYLARRA